MVAEGNHGFALNPTAIEMARKGRELSRLQNTINNKKCALFGVMLVGFRQ